MEIESLDGLKAAFDAWRASKRHKREKIPAALLERARRLARVHGVMAVGRVAKVDRGRLGGGRKASAKVMPAARQVPSAKVMPAARQVPSYSRIEVTATGGPFAEVETPAGLKVRFFTQSDEALGLLASLCAAGGGR